MTWLLIKKQLMEIFRAYFYNEKKQEKRSMGATIGMFVLFFVLMFLFLGGMFYALSSLILPSIVQLHIEWMFFALMGLLSIFMGVFGSVFSTYSILYLAKDNDLLFSLPVDASTIIISRIFSVYLMSCLYALVVWIPSQLSYLFNVSFQAGVFLASTLMGLAITLLVLCLSCLLGLVVAKISVKLKNRSIITTSLSLIFLALYYLVYFNANTIFSELLQNVLLYQKKIQIYAYPIYAFGNGACGNVIHLCLTLMITVIFTYAVWCFLKKSFFEISSQTMSFERIKTKKQKNQTRSVSSSLLYREFLHFKSSSSYMLNCSLGSVFMIGIAIYMLLKFPSVIVLLQQEGIDTALLAPLMVLAICTLASFNDITAPSISLEGKTIWLAKSLPVKIEDILNAKVKMHLILTGIPSLFVSLVCIYLSKSDVVMSLFMIITPVLSITFSALFGLIVNLNMPNLKWTNEMVPIKQSLSVFISMMVPMIVNGIAFLLYLNVIMNEYVYIIIYSILLFVACIYMYQWIRSNGTQIFMNL